MPSRPRLAIVVSHPIQYQVPMFRCLRDRGRVEPVVLYMTEHGTRPSFDDGFGRTVEYDVELLGGYEHRFVPNRSPRPGIDRSSGAVNPQIARALRTGSFDAVLVHGWRYVSNWLAIVAARAARIPYLVRCETRVDTEAGRPRPTLAAKRALVGPIVRGAGACLPIGERNRDFYLAYGVPPERLVPSPYSVDNARFARGGAAGRAARGEKLRTLGLDPTLPVVLYAGKLLSWKRPLDVLDAVAASAAPSNLVVIGDGELRSEVERRVAAMPGARWLGFVNQEAIAEWYGAADLYVMPSSHEPWGLGVNEAMAAGAVPVVSESVGCAPDLVDPTTGRTFPVGDVAALTGAIDELLGSVDLDSLRRSGRARVERYGIESTASGIEDAVALVTGRAPVAQP